MARPLIPPKYEAARTINDGTALRVELPYPPSINHYWRHNSKRKGAPVYISVEGKRYQHEVFYRLGIYTFKTLDIQRLSVRVAFYPRTKQEQDISNRIKVLEDCLQAIKIYCNDSQIDHLEIFRGRVVSGGRCVAIIEPLTKPLAIPPDLAIS